jgi:hypothetical protein
MNENKKKVIYLAYLSKESDDLSVGMEWGVIEWA